MMILFLVDEKKFLAIDKKSTLVNSLKRFGKDETGHELKLQEKLIEIKGKNKIMNGWSNYDYSYFLHSIEKHFSNMPRFVLCRFQKDIDGTLGNSYKFNDGDDSFCEIQEKTSIIFFDVNDEKKIKFWGNGITSKVKFDQQGSHNTSISNFDPYGITGSMAISSISEPLGVLTPELEADLKKQYQLDKKINPIDATTFEKIKKDLSEDKPGTDEDLPLPADDAITSAITEINEDLLIEPVVIRRIIAALYSGKSVLLTGPIGCGKTALALKIPSKAWKDFGGYYGEVVTATEDWGTQDVIGGIIPKLVKKESFR